MGITLSVLKELDDHDVFIAEMGARRRGDIAKLTKIVDPDYAIITSIGNCHLETFKTLENVAYTKFELPENMKNGGECYFSSSSESCEKLYKKYLGNKFLIGPKNGFGYADNISVGENGTSFDLWIDGKKIRTFTRLLGKFNIDNIVLASSLAYRLGVSLNDIASAIKTLPPISHRLEMIRTENCVILDDSYNSNEVGFEEALNVLSLFSGRKIVVTPGMVELGSKQADANFRLGARIADVCDYLIIMNKTNKNDLLSGAIAHNFKKENIFFANTREEQKDLIKLLSCNGCVILFENDLPDNYD